jgi:hypothetical protein
MAQAVEHWLYKYEDLIKRKDPISKNDQSKKGWGYGSGGTVPA